MYVCLLRIILFCHLGLHFTSMIEMEKLPSNLSMSKFDPPFKVMSGNAKQMKRQRYKIKCVEICRHISVRVQLLQSLTKVTVN